MFAVNDLLKPPIDVQIWFNAQLPGNLVGTKNITPSNTVIYPLPSPNVKLLSASNLIELSRGGVNEASRRSIPGQTIAEERSGIYIFPLGGSFTIFSNNTPGVEVEGIVSIDFGWWEEPICIYY